jgi:hypothetical protein
MLRPRSLFAQANRGGEASGLIKKRGSSRSLPSSEAKGSEDPLFRTILLLNQGWQRNSAVTALPHGRKCECRYGQQLIMAITSAYAAVEAASIIPLCPALRLISSSR